MKRKKDIKREKDSKKGGEEGNEEEKGIVPFSSIDFNRNKINVWPVAKGFRDRRGGEMSGGGRRSCRSQ